MINKTNSIKEIFDCYKKNPTGFDVPNILAGMGWYLLVNEIVKIILLIL